MRFKGCAGTVDSPASWHPVLWRFACGPNFFTAQAQASLYHPAPCRCIMCAVQSSQQLHAGRHKVNIPFNTSPVQHRPRLHSHFARALQCQFHLNRILSVMSATSSTGYQLQLWLRALHRAQRVANPCAPRGLNAGGLLGPKQLSSTTSTTHIDYSANARAFATSSSAYTSANAASNVRQVFGYCVDLVR